MDAIQYITPDFIITVTARKVTAQLNADLLPAEAVAEDITKTTLGRLLLAQAIQHFADADTREMFPTP